MSAMGELAEKIAADKERVAELAARIAATKQTLETASGKATELGAEDIARDLGKVERELAEAESGRAVLEGSLEKARWQIMAAIHGIGPGAPAGGARSEGDGGTGERLVELQPGDLDVLPPHERFGANPTGEELMGQDPKLGPFQKEHENADADNKMNRFKRLRRAAARNIEDLKSGGKELVAGTNSDIDSFKPEPPGTYTTTTQVPDQTPQIHSPPTAQPNPTDLVGTAIVMAVVVTDGAGRLFERIRRKRDGE